MAGLPINIPIPAESAIASYSWTDMAAGLGYVSFQGFASTTSTATTYVLTDNPIWSNPIGTSWANDAQVGELNFDSSTFNTPRNVKGRMYFFYSIGETSSGGNGGIQLTIEPMKVSGGVETSLGSVIGQNATSDGKVSDILYVDVPLTHFKIGDFLRIEVTATITDTAPGNFTCYFAFDPANRDWGSIDSATNPTYFKVEVPFKIDL